MSNNKESSISFYFNIKSKLNAFLRNSLLRLTKNNIEVKEIDYDKNEVEYHIISDSSYKTRHIMLFEIIPNFSENFLLSSNYDQFIFKNNSYYDMTINNSYINWNIVKV